VLLFAGSHPVQGDQDARVANTALTVGVERIALPPLRGEVSLVIQALLSQIEIVAGADAPSIAARFKGAAGSLCPKVELRGSSVLLQCQTRRLDAVLSEEGGRRFLNIRQLRGLPFRPAQDGPPVFWYDPRAVGIGGPCPGTTPASRGECRLAAERPLEAAALFKEALSTSERSFAAMRLGDLALIAGDPGTAVGWYQRCGRSGVFSRMATTRLCELNGECVEHPGEAYTGAGLPEPLRTEMELRAIRAAALMGRLDEAAARLTERLAAVGRPPACARTPLLCRRVALATLRDATGEQIAPALGLYLALPSRDKGPLALELGRAASERAADLGAPLFGANLLSSLSAQIAPEELAAHLERTAELYLTAGDHTRAAVIVDYARSKLGRRFGNSKWPALLRALQESASDSSPAKAKVDQERSLVADAVAASKRVHERSRSVPP
jgi:hypothetical protein